MAATLVIYESLFGNAKTIAAAIADGLRERLDVNIMDVELVDVGSARTTFDAATRLLVVGGPNHQFGMTRPASRQQAIRDFGARTSHEVGLREWLRRLSPAGAGTRVAVFDTRLDRSVLRRVDQTARSAERRLRNLGYTPIAPAEHFLVQTPTGPLINGETARAARWGRTLAACLDG